MNSENMQNQKWSFRHLESMSQNEVDALLDEIPSDQESIVSDIESVLGDELDIDEFRRPNNEDAFDIGNMDIVFEDQINNQDETTKTPNNQESESDSEDDVPLAVRLAKRNNSIFWTQNESYVTQTNQFTETTGPNIPNSAESPTDVFLELFPEDLIHLIVFQTNLYHVQKHGGGNGFTPTTEEEVKTFLIPDKYLT
uniref:Uncharacterized protein LOC114331570 n=1 Tax=Diabrotica virgifera virgifera TaxID=50390 RepID=A0A6P7FQD5_DIAVI